MSDYRISKNLEVLAKLKSASNKAFADDDKTLEAYTSWGGLRQAIFTPAIYKQLKHHLNDDEINSIKQTLTSAYYTPKLLVGFMWSALKRMGLGSRNKAGGYLNVLEPAAGIGAFLDGNYLPGGSMVDAIEIDKLSCQILKKLYSDICIINTGFEDFYCGGQKYDLIIGNPPYGSQTVKDIMYPDLTHLIIHHYFAAKAARMLKDQGIIAMVLPQFFLDNIKDHARDIISDAGVNLIAAYRLPDNLFANAQVTVDIVFLQKTSKKVEWQRSKRLRIGEHNTNMNEYFINNPQNVLGRLKIVPMYQRLGLTCKADDQDLRKQLKAVFAKINKII